MAEEPKSPIFSNERVRSLVAAEASEMAVYFPDFELYQDEDGSLFWLGKIEGMGELKITYPQTYPSQKFSLEALDLNESFNEELKRLVWSYDGITPTGALIVAMRLFLMRKVAKG